MRAASDDRMAYTPGMGLRDWWRRRRAEDDEAALEAEEEEAFDSSDERAASDIDEVRLGTPTSGVEPWQG